MQKFGCTMAWNNSWNCILQLVIRAKLKDDESQVDGNLLVWIMLFSTLKWYLELVEMISIYQFQVKMQDWDYKVEMSIYTLWYDSCFRINCNRCRLGSYKCICLCLLWSIYLCQILHSWRQLGWLFCSAMEQKTVMLAYN